MNIIIDDILILIYVSAKFRCSKHNVVHCTTLSIPILLRRYNITFPLLWDKGFSTWEAFDITSQPAAILLDRAGAPVKRWSGMFDTAEVLTTARKIA